MEKLNKLQVAAHMKQHSIHGKVDFFEEIQSLEKGAGLKVLKSEWNRKSTPYQYYYTNINKGKAVVNIIAYSDYYLFIKL